MLVGVPPHQAHHDPIVTMCHPDRAGPIISICTSYSYLDALPRYIYISFIEDYYILRSYRYTISSLYLGTGSGIGVVCRNPARESCKKEMTNLCTCTGWCADARRLTDLTTARRRT